MNIRTERIVRGTDTKIVIMADNKFCERITGGDVLFITSREDCARMYDDIATANYDTAFLNRLQTKNNLVVRDLDETAINSETEIAIQYFSRKHSNDSVLSYHAIIIGDKWYSGLEHSGGNFKLRVTSDGGFASRYATEQYALEDIELIKWLIEDYRFLEIRDVSPLK